MISEHSAHSTSLLVGWLSHLALVISMFVIVNFDALAQASDFKVNHTKTNNRDINQGACTSDPNLLILAWTGGGSWLRQVLGWCTRRRTHKHIHRQWQHTKTKTGLWKNVYLQKGQSFCQAAMSYGGSVSFLVNAKFYSNFHNILNSLWPSDAIWWQISGSTLAQVMACCLTAPSHYLNQCWLIISKV